MKGNDKLTEVNIKNSAQYYFDVGEIGNIHDINLSESLLDENSYENIFIYNIAYKTPYGAKHLQSLIFKQICQKIWSNYLTNYLINYLAANCLQSYTKYFAETIVFISNSGLHKKFSFCFSGDFIQYWQSFHFWRRNKQQALILCSFQIFLIFPYFLVLSRLASCKATHI